MGRGLKEEIRLMHSTGKFLEKVSNLVDDGNAKNDSSPSIQ